MATNENPRESETKKYLKEQIETAVHGALKLPIKSVSIKSDGTLIIQCGIEGDGAKNSFWQAVMEHAE